MAASGDGNNPQGESAPRARSPKSITDDVLVMPIVGAMDGARAQQALETALAGFAARQAKVVILDITGVARVDATVAEALIKTAKALQLLGAKTVLSGVRPEVARALVDQDVHLGSIVTLGTLQSSIAYALGPNGLRGSVQQPGYARQAM